MMTELETAIEAAWDARDTVTPASTGQGAAPKYRKC
jgi:hypothetical protein